MTGTESSSPTPESDEGARSGGSRPGSVRPRRPRRHDPHRRERIIEVTEQLIAERGLEGLSHRVIAERADVSLSATTYHFADREALIRAALERSADRYTGELSRWAAEHADDAPGQVVEALTDMVMHYLGPDRALAVMEGELFVAALRRPALREVAVRTSDDMAAALTPCLGAELAACVPPLLTGLCLHALTSPRPPARDEIRAVFRRLLDPAARD